METKKRSSFYPTRSLSPPRKKHAPANAFSVLMKASAMTNFNEEMYLWHHDDGTLSWGWGASGKPLPSPPSLDRKWSCKVSVKGPDGRKSGVMDVWTNLPPTHTISTVDDNAGLRALFPKQNLSRLPISVLKSMLQKNVRRMRGVSAVRCALELALRNWNEAIRRLLVIIIEDSLLHPAIPLLNWLMVASSKGYRPPPILLEAFLSVVYETSQCPVRDSTESSMRTSSRTTSMDFTSDTFSAPYPKSLRCSTPGRSDVLDPADVAAANIRRSLLMRVSYGLKPFDRNLLKGACLAWGERFGHMKYCACNGVINPCYPCSDGESSTMDKECPPKAPSLPSSGEEILHRPAPFGYAHGTVLDALEGNEWTSFIATAHVGTGIPGTLLSKLMTYVDRGGVANKNITGPLIRESDAILGGIDFHCCGILDELLESTIVTGKIEMALRLHRAEHVGTEIVSVRDAAKKAMWACSGNVNNRVIRFAFFHGEEEEGPSHRCCSSGLGFIEDIETPIHEMETRVWSEISPYALDWARKFVRRFYRSRSI